MKKKVLFCMDTLKGGGAEKVLIDILNKIDNKYEITLFLIFHEGTYLDSLPDNINIKYMIGSKLPILEKNKLVQKFVRKLQKLLVNTLFKYLSPKLLYKILIKDKFDTEVAFLEGKSTKLLSGSNESSTKIAWVHTNLKTHHWTSAIYKINSEEKEQYSIFDKIIFVSEDALEGYLDAFNLESSDSLKVVYNPIDGVEIEKKANMNEEIYDDFTICSVGRLGHEKGYDRLLRVHAKLISEGLNHKLILLGDGIEKDNLVNLCKDLGVVQSVNFLGFKKNPYKYIKNTNLFVCSSRAEGYSLVIAEAMKLGLPVLSTNCGGTREVLENGKFGLLVDNTEEGIYEGIKGLLLNPERLERLKNESIERSLDFNIDKTIADICKIIG